MDDLIIVRDNGELTYDAFVNSYKELSGYQGNLTWEQLDRDTTLFNNELNTILLRSQSLEEPEVDEVDDSNLQTIELFRFRNTTFDTGTYVFVGEQERDAILDNPDFNQTFELEGNGNPAFTASTTPGEDLIPFYRLASFDTPGTFLFVSTSEYQAIFADDSAQRNSWEKEGLDGDGEDIPEFYLLDSSANRGTQFNRFQNSQNGTFLYAGSEET